MAGGKETPRQKMVGMMYLVLTALLALQVSNAVLDKFIFIDESLKHSVDVSRDAINKVFKGMQDLVAKEGNREKDVAVLKKAEEVKNETAKLLEDIHKMREDLIAATGGRDQKDGSYVGAKDYDKVMSFMIGAEGAKNGKAYDLKAKLNSYIEKVRKYDSTLQSVPLIAIDGKDMSMYKANTEYNATQRTKDFGEVNFGETPLVAALAVMRQMESEVARVEAKALEVLSQKVGVVVVKFDKIVARVTAESKVVAAGTKYKAKMFIAASSSKSNPRMSSTAGGVRVENGEGLIEFTATAGDYDRDGNAKKTWKGSITIPTAYGDTTFTVEEEYIVAKPVIQVQSANVSALYLNCGNELNIQVPALGSAYEPSFGATGAEIIRGDKKGVITVVPSAASVEIKVSSGGNYLGSEKFKVKLLPKPSVEIRNGGKLLDVKLGGAMPRGLKALAVADASIRDAIPKDARYKITEWEVTLARGRRPIASKKFSTDDVNLSDMAAQAKEGDRLVIEIKGVKRMNFKGQLEDVKGVNDIINYPITQ